MDAPNRNSCDRCGDSSFADRTVGKAGAADAKPTDFEPNDTFGMEEAKDNSQGTDKTWDGLVWAGTPHQKQRPRMPIMTIMWVGLGVSSLRTVSLMRQIGSINRGMPRN